MIKRYYNNYFMKISQELWHTAGLCQTITLEYIVFDSQAGKFRRSLKSVSNYNCLTVCACFLLSVLVLWNSRNQSRLSTSLTFGGNLALLSSWELHNCKSPHFDSSSWPLLLAMLLSNSPCFLWIFHGKLEKMTINNWITILWMLNQHSR